ncbi:MAG: hypothetical protein SVU32_03155, partial [Candidatus Nanohaloarchaea archaeon]|nr:hypothetical protein [Candidatus Nanohaloarchaea archaeon]
ARRAPIPRGNETVTVLGVEFARENATIVARYNETVVTDATETDKEIEKILMLSEFKGLPSDIYQPLREGFDDTYTQGISRKEETLSTLRGIVEPAVAPLFGDAENVNNRSPLNALDNLLKS